MKVTVDIPDSIDLSKVNDIKLYLKYYKNNNEYSYVTEGFAIQEERPQGDLISRSALKEEISSACYNCASRGEDDYNCKYHCPIYDFLTHIDNASTVEPNNEYGAIQYSNGFNDGFTLAKDTIIQNIAKQYSAHNELVPEWLSIGDLRGEKNDK